MFWRLLGAFGILLVAAVGLLGLVLARKAEARELRLLVDNLHARALLIQEDIRRLSADRLQPRVEELSRLGPRQVRISLIRADGKVLADSAPGHEHFANHKDRPEILAAAREGVGIDVRRSESIDKPLMYLALRVDGEDDFTGPLVAFVRVALPLDQVEEQLAGLWRVVVSTAGFTTEGAVGRRLWDVVRQRPLLDVVQRALSHSEPQKEELNWNALASRSVTVHAARLPGDPPRGAVLVVHDTSELRRLERLRHEFVANVSHELKTPLAVISACVETLLEGGAAEDPAHCRSFLERVAEQGERLHRLILDL